MMRAAVLALVFASFDVAAHSSSDAYLTLTIAPDARIQAQWDVALRDLHFVLGLDDDGDGNLTWGEVRKHEAQIAGYAYDSLRVTGDGTPCAIRPTRQSIATRTDGAYAALFFDIVCTASPRKLALDYRLFFPVDPSHRAIVVIRNQGATATSLLSPASARIEITLPPGKRQP